MFRSALSHSRPLVNKLARHMSTMKAVVVERIGGPEVLEYKDHPKPQVSSGKILVKNHAIGVNFIDTYHRSGVYPLPTPFVPGREGSGEVVEVGEGVSDFKVGDRVAYVDAESYAEYTAVNSLAAGKIPDNVSYDDATALLLQGLTAWTMVRDGYPVKKGDYVLVHAAAGGVGLLLCQMANLLGATVIGTVSTEEKAALAKENGAHHTINYSHEDTVARVNEITNGQGCHAVLDGVGASTWETSLQSVRRLGTLISFGNASGVVPPIQISCLSDKSIKLMRPKLFSYLATREDKEKWFNELFQLQAEHKLKLRVHKTYKLEDAQSAHVDIQSRKTTGKLLIEL
ncbi:hypothetical protein INT43_004001 [Umbelopsis isabellina]|uniref:Probable quinone oxidoreductase n=1 Tax=Mortierella isabellina TaxID=91625 RepID=A0A8H7PTV3_MORIS|nr:hypothetical protein INT43_004001 [Umbelopsis isabellina]